LESLTVADHRDQCAKAAAALLSTVHPKQKAYSAGFFDGSLATGERAALAVSQPARQKVALAAFSNANILGFSKTLDTYVHGVSDFYDNRPELKSRFVSEFVGCFADVPLQSCDVVAQKLAKHSL